jgi:putative DNA methylase
MLKRLIEVALPLKEVSEQSAREKSIRHGHISTLHIWWARRPLAACRAVVFASLIPDPDDPDCPESFKQLVRQELGDGRFKPKDSEGNVIEDTPRNRCLEFIKHLVKWVNLNDSTFIKPARSLIHEAHKIFNPDSKNDMPNVLDPFAGGGAIPLEALRLGCQAHAIDINPVAHLIELCTLVYPQKYGITLPKDKDIPDYIKNLIAHNKAKRKSISPPTLFDSHHKNEMTEIDDLTPDVDISEDEYRRNPLAADVKYWGHWVLSQAKKELGQFYPSDEDGSFPVAYLWARTVKCPNPACGATIPLVRQLWLCNKSDRKIAMRMMPNTKSKICDFEIVEGKQFDFDPDKGTMQRGQGSCPFCQTVATSKYLQAEGNSGRIKQQLMSVVTVKSDMQGKQYRSGSIKDVNDYYEAEKALLIAKQKYGEDIIPQEPLIAWSGVFNAPLFGMAKWGDLFNSRQSFSLVIFVQYVNKAVKEIQKFESQEYAKAVCGNLALVIGRLADYSSSLCVWGMDFIAHTFGRQALPMIWDYAEGAPIYNTTGNWAGALDWINRVLKELGNCGEAAYVKRGSAISTPYCESEFDAIITDPPYYDAVPYSDLSDFFYVWHKRAIGSYYPDTYKTPLTPKSQELVSHLGSNYPGVKKTASDYENGMSKVFLEMNRTLSNEGIAAVMFAHKETSAWETLITGLIKSGLLVSGSWPIHTERSGRLRANDSAALASSVTLICRKRAKDAGEGIWDDVRKELRKTAKERLEFFWNHGIRGADFFISAIGPALSVYGKYQRVVRLNGSEVTVSEFLDEVRSLVTGYVLEKIIHNSRIGTIDPESQFYVVWRWSYGDTKVQADEAFKLSQALGLSTDIMWDRTGILEKSGQNVQALSIAKRMRISHLGEPQANGTPASFIDILHRLCDFRDKSDTTGMAEYLARSGHVKNETLWLVAQAISEILPDGDKEKQLFQGLLNQRDNLLQLAKEKLFE